MAQCQQGVNQKEKGAAPPVFEIDFTLAKRAD